MRREPQHRAETGSIRSRRREPEACRVPAPVGWQGHSSQTGPCFAARARSTSLDAHRRLAKVVDEAIPPCPASAGYTDDDRAERRGQAMRSRFTTTLHGLDGHIGASSPRPRSGGARMGTPSTSLGGLRTSWRKPNRATEGRRAGSCAWRRLTPAPLADAVSDVPVGPAALSSRWCGSR